MNVVDYLKAMSLIVHANFELRDLNYDSFHIKIVPCILTMFDGDVLLELSLFVSPNNHFG
jgi:hypothetical protein